jgi:D-xylose 1-dehydrogenase (NADP+, D-xylono-1,5-lactone-forming)
MRVLRWGILGTSRINQSVAPAIASSPRHLLQAVASRSIERARAEAQRFAIPRAYGQYSELLADHEIDVVYVALPNVLHAEWTIAALRAGKHVLCEKPLAPSLAEVDRIIEAARSNAVVVAEAFMYRHHPQTARIHALLQAGAIGPLRLIRASQRFRVDGEGDVRFFRELEGGALMDVGCYCVDFARYIAGEPTRVYGEQRLNDDGVDLLFSGTMRFANDVLAQFDAGIDVPQRDHLELVGADGTMEVHDPWMSGEAEKPAILIHRDGETGRVATEGPDAYRLQLEDFAAAIEGERAPLLGRDDAIAQAAAIEALYASADAGRPVALVSGP